MLVDLKTILADTREKHYAVGLFNCVTLEMTKGILAAAEELHSPVYIYTRLCNNLLYSIIISYFM